SLVDQACSRLSDWARDFKRSYRRAQTAPRLNPGVLELGKQQIDRSLALMPAITAHQREVSEALAEAWISYDMTPELVCISLVDHRLDAKRIVRSSHYQAPLRNLEGGDDMRRAGASLLVMGLALLGQTNDSTAAPAPQLLLETLGGREHRHPEGTGPAQ